MRQLIEQRLVGRPGLEGMACGVVVRGAAVLRAVVRGAAVLGAVILGTGTVQAQAPEVEAHTEGFVAEEERPEEDETSWTASMGGALSTGNTRAWSLNGGSQFTLVRGKHAFNAMGVFNFSRADLPEVEEEGYVDTAKNLNVRTRYDYFLTRLDGLFAAAVGRWDRFAGLDPRLQAQTGYLRNLVRATNHRFWVEVGYDLTYDRFYYDEDLVMDTADLPGHQVVHSARLFLGYDNRLNEAVTLLTGIEALVNVQELGDYRINATAAVNSKLMGQLSMELRFMAFYDSEPPPVPGIRNLDTNTLVTLVYQLL